jgi:hypothetical protein
MVKEMFSSTARRAVSSRPSWRIWRRPKPARALPVELEAQAFKGWLVSIGQKVAEAAKEGGFLGFGGTRVSEQETSALKALSSVLGAKT